jgi:hypothetical protein
LLKDLDGNIQLSVPVAGDPGGAKVGLRSLVGQALRKALIGALASPLKLFGAITADGKVQSLAPEPIAFAPGRTDMTEAGSARVGQLAGLLSASPGRLLRARPHPGRALAPGGLARGRARLGLRARQARRDRHARGRARAPGSPLRRPGHGPRGGASGLAGRRWSKTIDPARLAALADALRRPSRFRL